MSRLPIRLRVTLVFFGVMALVLAATGLFVYLRMGTELDQSIDQDLGSRADQLTALVRASDAGLGESVRSVLRQRRGSFAQILTPSGKLVNPGAQRGRPVLRGSALERARRGPTFVERPRAPGLGDDPVRLLARPLRGERRPLIVVVGASLEARDDALESLATLLLIGGPVALLLASLAAYGAARASLRPVDAMRRRAAEISATETQQRLPVPPARDELRWLGETLNHMLNRLQAALERERGFVDDASHELRTPLALHKTELELALRYGETREELRAAIASAIEEADRLSQLAEDLLVMARADKGRLAIEARPVEVRDLFEAIRGRLAGAVSEAGRSLRIDDPDGLVVDADRMRIEQALANLVENGLRHGSGQIHLWARATEDGGVELHVSDAGPGFPPEFLPHAFERFRRADSARSGAGSGLGLAIVDAIAQAHRGDAGARNIPEGGADVWIALGRG
jgi:two-component system, OmpR family, sensor kinase